MKKFLSSSNIFVRKESVVGVENAANSTNYIGDKDLLNSLSFKSLGETSKVLSEDTAGIDSSYSLSIAGMVPMSTVDWPGKICCTLFLQGCPWRCVYCHNFDILDPRKPGQIPFGDVLQLLEKRNGLLDGVVFSGGEATRQESLLCAIKEVKNMGFSVGLHTAGAYPKKLAKLVEYVDWVGIDVKALPQDYSEVVGRANAGLKAYESLKIVLDSNVDYEVRLTVFPNSITSSTAFDIAKKCSEMGVRNFALQQARQEGAPEDFVASAVGWDEEFLEIGKQVESLPFDIFHLRAS